MGNTELDKLLGDDKTGGPNPAATPADKKALDAETQKLIEIETTKVKDALLKRIDDQKTAYEEKISILTAKVAPLDALQPKPEVKDEEFDVSTAEGWKSHIDKTSKTAANEAVEQIEQSALNKAKQSFLTLHPDYDAAKLEALIPLARGIGIKDKFDKDSILDAFDSAWTVENRETLKKQAQLAEQFKSQSDHDILDLASSGASNPVKQGMDTVDATPSDLRAYREYQRTGGEMTLAKFVEVSRHV